MKTPCFGKNFLKIVFRKFWSHTFFLPKKKGVFCFKKLKTIFENGYQTCPWSFDFSNIIIDIPLFLPTRFVHKE